MTEHQKPVNPAYLAAYKLAKQAPNGRKDAEPQGVDFFDFTNKMTLKANRKRGVKIVADGHKGTKSTVGNLTKGMIGSRQK